MSLGDVVAAVYVQMKDRAVELVRLSVGGVALPSLKLVKAVDQLSGKYALLQDEHLHLLILLKIVDKIFEVIQINHLTF